MKESRFLEVLWPTFAALGLLLLALPAWQGERVSVVLLLCFSFMWLGLAYTNSRSWKRTLKQWESTIALWNEANELVSDTRSLLVESLNALAVYDADQADEIRERINTVTSLRMRNIDDRVKEMENR